MTHWAAWTIAVTFLLSMSVAAFAEKATLSCSISDGTTRTYTLYGDSCESTKETATCSGPNGNTVDATCDRGCINSGGYYKVACQTAVKNPPSTPNSAGTAQPSHEKLPTSTNPATTTQAGLASPSHAEDFNEINNLKGKIWEAEVAQRNFAAGLPHCNELNGTNFFFYKAGRVLNLEAYRRSLDNLVAEGTFNPETRRPWNKQDADERWAQVQKEAAKGQADCAAVASLPSLRKKLDELQQQH